MTEAVRRRLVRPVFLKLSLLAFVLLVPVVLHTAWDYYEARRIDRALALIRQKREPTSLQQIEPRPRRTEAFRAAAYYQAGAALAAEFTPDDDEPRRAPPPAPTTLLFRVLQAEREGKWTDELLADLRQYVHDREEALVQLDRAASLTFQGFPPGTSYNYRAGSLSNLARVGGYRTTVLAHDGAGAGGARSLYAELRLRRAVGQGVRIRPTGSEVIAHLDLLLNRTHPPSDALKLVADGLAELDRDDELKQRFLRWRAGFIETGLGQFRVASMISRSMPPLLVGFRASVDRPWMERVMANRLETLAEIISAVDRPWPQRVSAVADAYVRQGIPGEDTTGFKRADVLDADATILELALVRCARVAVAIERYRREHAERMPDGASDLVPGYLEAVPVDPYSGGAIIMRPEATSYVVYSVGTNRRDENGDFSVFRAVQGRQERRDIGIRARYR